MALYKIKLDAIFNCSLVVMMFIILPKSGDNETNNFFLLSVGCNLFFDFSFQFLSIVLI